MNRQAKAFVLLDAGMELTAELHRQRYERALALSRELSGVLEELARLSADRRRPGVRTRVGG